MRGEAIHLTSIHFCFVYPFTRPYIRPFLIHPPSAAEEGLTGGGKKRQVITSLIVANEFYACIFVYVYMNQCCRVLKKDI